MSRMVRVIQAPDGSLECADEDAVGIVGRSVPDLAAQLLAIGFAPDVTMKVHRSWRLHQAPYGNGDDFLCFVKIGTAAGVTP